jgi:hypothetical protein
MRRIPNGNEFALKKSMVMSAFAIVFALFTLIGLQVFNKVAAQERVLDMNNLLNRLYEDEVEVLFQFAIPLVADQNVWIVPDGINGSEDEITIQIAEIGEDYICFRMRSGQAIDMRCTPFSNIVSVSYLDMPE